VTHMIVVVRLGRFRLCDPNSHLLSIVFSRLPYCVPRTSRLRPHRPPTTLRYHWIMSRIHPECPDSDPSDRSVAADVLLRHPDEEEEEDEGDGKEDDNDTDDDGYSE
jgi:hypothetical protein